jgi:hypothetical protein
VRSTNPFVIGVIENAGFAKALAERAENTPRKKRKCIAE